MYKERIKRAQKAVNVVYHKNVSFLKLLRKKRYQTIIRFFKWFDRFEKVHFSLCDFFDPDPCVDVNVGHLCLHFFYKDGTLLYVFPGEDTYYAGEVYFRGIRDLENLRNRLKTYQGKCADVDKFLEMSRK